MIRTMLRMRVWFVVTLLLALTPAAAREGETVDLLHLVRLPDGGVQPDVAVDERGIAHVVYLAGEPGAADVFYLAMRPDGTRVSAQPIRVNSQPGSAIATGTIRGAQIALGRGGRVHVAWNGSGRAEPRPPINPKTKRAGMPMLYARSDPSRRAFEPQRNLITRTTNLDGGGSIAADPDGGVFVAWHAHPASGEGTEEARRVWLARSEDDGATFSREEAVAGEKTGVCGCCALRLAASGAGDLHLLYRSATATVHRDIHSLISRDRGRTFAGAKLHEWNVGACPMTSMAIADAQGGVLQAWETDGQVFFGRRGAAGPPQAPPAGPGSPRRKHPRLAVGADGTVLLVWTEGTSWAKGGALAWQAFAPDGRATAMKGSKPGVPAWGFAAAVARPDGGFTIVY